MSTLHVAIIMDGNGRWATARGWPRWRGHLAGVRSVRALVEAAPELGIQTLTLYAFSSDNWKRPAAEVGRLFRILRDYCTKERDALVRKGVRLTAIGRRDRLPRSARQALEDIERATRHGATLTLRLAIDYSGRETIVDATRSLARRVAHGELAPDEISRDDLNRTIGNGTPPPDLVIRTAGEQRLSDFLLWESAYAELYFTPVLWPDFRRPHLTVAIDAFRGRERRFGNVVTPDIPAPSMPDGDRLAV